MFGGIIGKISGLEISTTQNTSSVTKKLKKSVANLQKSLFQSTQKNNDDWKKDYPDIAEMYDIGTNLPHDIALLFKHGTKTNQTDLTNDTILIEILNGDKKTFVTLDKKSKEFATTKQSNNDKYNKITLQCDGEKYDICFPFAPENMTLENISRQTRTVSQDTQILETLSIKKKQ